MLFLIRSLGRGGAERQLATLATGLRRDGWEVAVACFYAGGPFQRELERGGVPIIDLHKRGRWDVTGFLWRLARALRQYRPDIVHGYLTVGNLLSLLAPLASPGSRVVWGVRSSFIDRQRYDWMSRATFALSCRMARRADRISTFIHVCEHPDPISELRRVYDTVSETLGYRTLQQFEGRDVRQLEVMLGALGFLPEASAGETQAYQPHRLTPRLVAAVDAFRRSEGLEGAEAPAGYVDRDLVERLWRALARSGKDRAVRARLLEATMVTR